MSLILDTLRKAKNLATGSAPQRAPAYLKSFGFADQQAPQNKTRKILISYVLPVVILGSVIAAGVMYWISMAAESPMAEQAQLLEPDGEFLPLGDEIEEAAPEGEELPAMPAEGYLEDDPLTADAATSEPADGPGGQEEAGGAEAAFDAPLPSGIPGPLPTETDTPEPEPTEDRRMVLPVAQQEDLATNAPEEPEPPPEQNSEDESPDSGNAVDPPEPATGASASEVAASASEVIISPPEADPFELAVRYQQMGEYLKAFELYDEVLEQDYFNAQVHNNVGLMHMALSDNSQAIEAFRRAIRIDSDYDKAHNNLGTALVNDGQDSEAEREFQRALDLNPTNAAAMTNLAILYRNDGKLEEAKFQYLRALQIDPSSADTHYNLALLYEEQGENGSAVEHFTEFLSLGSDRYPQLVDQVEEKIRALSPPGP